MPALTATPHNLAARGDTAKQEKTLIYILAIAAVALFSGVIVTSIHRSVMEAREERLRSADYYKSRSVFVKLGAWIWRGIVILICAFFAPFTKTFWKETWADGKVLFSPYSGLGVCINAYTCGCCCDADPDYDPELAVAGAKKEPSAGGGDGGIVAQEPKPNPTISVTGAPAPRLPAPAVVVGEA